MGWKDKNRFRFIYPFCKIFVLRITSKLVTLVVTGKPFIEITKKGRPLNQQLAFFSFDANVKKNKVSTVGEF